MTPDWSDKQFPPHPCHFYKASQSLQICHKSFENSMLLKLAQEIDWHIQTSWIAAHKHPSWPYYRVLCLSHLRQAKQLQTIHQFWMIHLLTQNKQIFWQPQQLKMCIIYIQGKRSICTEKQFFSKCSEVIATIPKVLLKASFGSDFTIGSQFLANYVICVSALQKSIAKIYR